MLIGTATALAGAEQSRQQAEAQANYQAAQAAEYARVSDLNNKAAVQEYANQAAAERITQMQEQEATSEKIQETQREALEKKGTMRHQLDMSSVNHELNIAAMHDKAQNRINSQANYVSPGVSSTNSFLTTALGIGSSAITAFGYYDKYSNKGANDIKAVKKEP